MTEKQIISLKQLVGNIKGNLERNFCRLELVEEILSEQLIKARAAANSCDKETQCK